MCRWDPWLNSWPKRATIAGNATARFERRPADPIRGGPAGRVERVGEGARAGPGRHQCGGTRRVNRSTFATDSSLVAVLTPSDSGIAGDRAEMNLKKNNTFVGSHLRSDTRRRCRLQ